MNSLENEMWRASLCMQTPGELLFCDHSLLAVWTILCRYVMFFRCRFTKNLSADKINLSTFKGEGELSNLELDEIVLTELLELPSWLRLTNAWCNRVSFRIQWTKLKSVPIFLVSFEEVWWFWQFLHHSLFWLHFSHFYFSYLIYSPYFKLIGKCFCYMVKGEQYLNWGIPHSCLITICTWNSIQCDNATACEV